MEDAFSDEDIQQALRTEEALLELDTKLRDFFDTHIATKITKMIEKFKGKHPNIAFG